MIDITADPLIHEIIEIPETSNEAYRLSYEVASGAIPYVDVKPYQQSYQSSPEERIVGVFNFFKGNMSLPITDVKSRLMRKHKILKTIWHMRKGDEAIDIQVEK